MRRVAFLCLAAALALCLRLPARAEEPVRPARSRPQLEALWRDRIQSFLDRGTIPLVDMESRLPNADADGDLGPAMAAMDRAGVALMVCDGYQAEKQGKESGYRWGFAVHRAANRHPDRIVLASNGGSSPNWTKGKGGSPTDFIDQTEIQARSGDYPILGEFEFRHYMSNSQCRKGHTDRDVDLPLDGENGRRLFALSQETGLAFLIHLEPEDAPLEALERMLAACPRARVIACHFGQIRHPERQRRFGPELVRRLLATYPNLYYDLSVGEPGRRYACDNTVLDTVLWKDSFAGQSDALKPEYAALLTEFSTRFVSGFDYGGGRKALPDFIEERAANMRRILAALPDPVRHDIAYRNAWRLLTGREW